MSSPDPFDFIVTIITGAFWLLMLILWLGFMSEVKARLRSMEQVANRQIQLLDAIVLNTMTPERRAEIEAARQKQAAAAEQTRIELERERKKSSARGWVLLGLFGLLAALMVIALYKSGK